MTKRRKQRVAAKPADERALREHAEKIRAAAKRTVKDIVVIGRHLTAAKKLVGHGNWLPWLEREFGWTEQTALNFMRLHELGRSNSKRVLDLDLPVSVLYLLAAPSTPAYVRDKIIERAEGGEKVTVPDIKLTINRAKHPLTPRHVEVETRHFVTPIKSVGYVKQPPVPAPPLISEEALTDIARDGKARAIVRDLLQLSVYASASELEVAKVAELLRADKEKLATARRSIELAVRVLEALGGHVEEERDVRPRFLRLIETEEKPSDNE